MVEVHIECPLCYNKNKIEVQQDIVKESKRGLVAVNVPQFLVCEHAFIAYIDKNLKVRDCIISDFCLELPQFDTKSIFKESPVPESNDVDLYLLSINMNARWLIQILKACFLGKKILVINDLLSIKNHLINFFEFIFQETFKTNIAIENKEYLKKNKKKLKEHTVFDGICLTNENKDVIDVKKDKITKKIVHDFLAEPNPKTSLKRLRNEIQKAYELSKLINDLKKKQEEGKILNLKEITKALEEEFHFTIDPDYLDFLMEIVVKYYGDSGYFTISRISKFF